MFAVCTVRSNLLVRHGVLPGPGLGRSDACRCRANDENMAVGSPVDLAANEARVKSEQARLAVEQHIAAHAKHHPLSFHRDL